MLIGAPRIVDSWAIVPTVPSEMVRADRQALAQLGIRDAWIPFVQRVAAWDGSNRWALGVGGQYPARSLDEINQAVSEGLGLELQLPPLFDLRVLVEPFSAVTSLSVGTPPEGLVGWDVLSQAARLETLIVGEPSAPMGIERLPKLQRFMGSGRFSVEAAANPNLISLELDDPDWPSNLEIRGPVQKLSLEGASNISGLPQLAHPLELRDLRIERSRVFDAESLSPAQHLKEVRLVRAGNIRNVGALSRLPSLELLDLSGVISLRGRQKLKDVSAKRAFLMENYVISDALANELRGAITATTWTIGPRQKSDDQRYLARLHFDEDGLDTTTVAPFVIDEPADPADGYVLELPSPHIASTAGDASQISAVIWAELKRASPKLVADEGVWCVPSEDKVLLGFLSLGDLLREAKRYSGLIVQGHWLDDRLRFVDPDQLTYF